MWRRTTRSITQLLPGTNMRVLERVHSARVYTTSSGKSAKNGQPAQTPSFQASQAKAQRRPEIVPKTKSGVQHGLKTQPSGPNSHKIWKDAKRSTQEVESGKLCPSIVSEVKENAADVTSVSANEKAQVGGGMASARTSKYSHQIRRLHDGCEWDLIIATVDDMRAEGVALDTYTQWATILAYENLGRYKNILEIFDALKRKGFAPEELAYSAAISACGERGQWENAADLYTRMKRDNISGTPEAHITAIAAYEKGRMWKELIGVAEDIRNNTLVVSDTNTNNIVMSSALLRHFYKQALDVFKVMVSLGHSRDVRTYSIALEACQIGGIKNRAIEVFNMMGQEGIPRSAATYISVVRTFMKTEQFAEALEWLDSVEREVKDIPADVYVYAIALCGKYGQWNKAMGLRYELERVTAATVPQYRRVENDYNGARP